jgi:hypothetical protein
MYSFFKKVIKKEFLTVLIYSKFAISEKIRKKAWWQHQQTKLPMARMPAILYKSLKNQRIITDFEDPYRPRKFLLTLLLTFVTFLGPLNSFLHRKT